MQRHGESDGEALVGKATDLRREPDGGDGDVALRDAKPIRAGLGDLADCGEQAVVVGQRLAHAHEDDVGQARALRRHHRGGCADLVNNLRGGQVAVQTALAGSAERTRHAAARLGRNAQRGAVRVAHEHGLQQDPVVQAPQGLGGVALVGFHGAHGVEQGWEQRVLDQLALGLGEVRHGQRVRLKLAVVVARDLVRAELRQPELLEGLDAFLFGQVSKVLRRHAALRGKELDLGYVAHSVPYFGT